MGDAAGCLDNKNAVTAAAAAPPLRLGANDKIKPGSEGWSHEQFLSTLLEQEAVGREQSGIQIRLKQSRFPGGEDARGFQLHPAASVKKALLLHLASNRYIEARENVIFWGHPGRARPTSASRWA